MSFLNLSTLQVLLLGLLTIGAVVALFFLKLRHRRVVVGSAMLWQRVLQDRESNSLIEKLRRWFSLLLAITIALLIAVSVGRPYLSSGNGLGPVAIVLDTSESMLALTASGRTRWEVALDEAERIVASSQTPGGMLAADTSGRVQTSATADDAEILAALGRMEPFPGDGRFPAIPATDAAVYFITDGVRPPRGVPADATVVSVFEPADNVGITSFEIQVDPTSTSGYTAYLEVANYSEIPKQAAIVVAGVGGQRVVRAADIPSGDVWQEALDLAGFRGGGIQARVQAEGDRFANDDVAFSYLPIRGELSVTLVTRETDGYLETLLGLTPEVALSVVSPAGFEESASTDVYVFEGTAPASAPGRPSLVFGINEAAWLPRIQGRETDVQISSWDDAHPIMQFVPIYDLGIDSAAIVDPGNRTVLAASGNAPLFLVDEGEETGSAKAVIVTFELPDSDFAFHLGFPIFVENVLAWFSGETLAMTSPLGEIEMPAGTTAVSRLDGTALETLDRAGRTVVELNEPDLLTAMVAGRRIRVAANMANPTGSNINGNVLTETQTGSATLALAGNELWFYMLVAATLLIALEWWTYNRRITL